MLPPRAPAASQAEVARAADFLAPFHHLLSLTSCDSQIPFAGVIILTASSGGLFPMPMAPAYAAAKAGLVHFTRSLAPRLHKRGIRLCALCPQQVDTALVSIVLYCLVEHFEGSAPCPQQIHTAWVSRLGLCLLHQAGCLLNCSGKQVACMLLPCARHAAQLR